MTQHDRRCGYYMFPPAWHASQDPEEEEQQRTFRSLVDIIIHDTCCITHICSLLPSYYTVVVKGFTLNPLLLSYLQQADAHGIHIRLHTQLSVLAVLGRQIRPGAHCIPLVTLRPHSHQGAISYTRSTKEHKEGVCKSCWTEEGREARRGRHRGIRACVAQRVCEGRGATC
jgi:hypothetical protein